MMGDGGEVDDLGLAQSAHDVSRVAEVITITHAFRRLRARAPSRPKQLISAATTWMHTWSNISLTMCSSWLAARQRNDVCKDRRQMTLNIK